MTSPEMKKASAATEAIKKSEFNPYKGERTMSTISPRNHARFDAAINVAGLTVMPGVMTGGTEPDESVVTLKTHDEILSFTTSEACALAAALQAVSVHLMEQSEVAA